MFSHGVYVFALGRATARVERAWTQGAYSRHPDGRALLNGIGTSSHTWAVDLAGAITQEGRELGLSDREIDDLRLIVTAALPYPYCSDLSYGLEHFNDAVTTSKLVAHQVILKARLKFEASEQVNG